MSRPFALVLAILAVSASAGSTAWAQAEELVPPRSSAGQRVGPRITTRPLAQAEDQRPIIADDGLIIGENLIVAMGAKPDRIWAFSREQGSWNRQTVPEDQLDGPIVPQVTSNLVVFQMGRRLYAFSAPRGQWHNVELEHHVRADISLGPDMAWCRVGPRVYAFSAKNGGWSSINVFKD